MLAMHAYMDVGVRVTHGAVTEEQLLVLCVWLLLPTATANCQLFLNHFGVIWSSLSSH